MLYLIHHKTVVILLNLTYPLRFILVFSGLVEYTVKQAKAFVMHV